jgi:hypothetical protein
MVIAFDSDNTLIDEKGKPRLEIIELLKALSPCNEIVVWSANSQHAEEIARRVGIFELVSVCASKTNIFLKGQVDIAFDDQIVKLAKFNIKI